jgi:transposase
MLELVYDDAAVTMKTVYRCFERFRNRFESFEDEERSGHPSASKTQENVEIVSKMIQTDD